MRLVLALLCILCIPSVIGVEALLLDEHGDPIRNAIILVDGGFQLLAPNQKLILYNESEIYVRSTSGEGFSYRARIPENGWPSTIIMQPIGTVLGRVIDTRNNLVDSAQVRIYCSSEEHHITTDTTGHFKVYIEPGECIFSAEARGRSGTNITHILKGDSQEVVISMGTTSWSANKTQWPIILIIVIVLAILIGMYFFRKKPFVAQKVDAALTRKERLIIDELIIRGGKARVADIRHATQIPRTSLIRTLRTLENRNIIIRKKEHRKAIIELIK